MARYAKELRAKIEAHIPNPKKLKYATLITPFADPIIESLMEGNEVEVAFDTQSTPKFLRTQVPLSTFYLLSFYLVDEPIITSNFGQYLRRII